MRKAEDKREYYEVLDFSLSKMEKAKRYEIIYAIVLMIFILALFALPIAVNALLRAYLSTRCAPGAAAVISTISMIITYVLVTLFLFGVADRKIPIPEKLRLSSGIYKTKYYLNVPQAYKKVHVEDVRDGDVMDGFYLNGAICSDGEIEQDRLSYVYNLLNDTYALHAEDITMYRISAEDFMFHYTFFDAPYLIRSGYIYVLPLAVLGIDREEYNRLRSEQRQVIIAGLKDFADLLEGRSDYRRTTYRFRDKAREYFKGK